MTYFIERVHTHSQEGGFDHRLAIVWEFDRNAQAFKTQEFKYWVVGYAIGFKRMNHHLMLILEISASSQKVCWISRLRLHRVWEGRLAGCADVAQNKSKPIRPSQTMCCPAATKRSSSIILSSPPPIPFETTERVCPLPKRNGWRNGRNLSWPLRKMERNWTGAWTGETLGCIKIEEIWTTKL